MLVYRSVKGANLTPTEVDNNFHDVDDRITFIEDNPPEARSIDEITALGSTLIILYTDSTEDVVTIPGVVMRGRGDWQPDTSYLVNDVINANGVVYLVTFQHISDASSDGFNPGANDGNGHDYYSPLFDIPELVIPPGGDTGFVLSKLSADDNDMEWQNRGIPDGGTAGQVLTKLTSDDRDADWVSLSSSAGIAVSQKTTGTTFTPTADDANTFIRCTNASGCTVTINSNVFDVDSELAFRQENDAFVELVEANSSVIFEGVDGFDNRTETRGGMLFCKFVEDTSDGEIWQIWGGPLVETSV